MHVKKLLAIATLGLSFGFPVPRASADRMYWTAPTWKSFSRSSGRIRGELRSTPP